MGTDTIFPPLKMVSVPFFPRLARRHDQAVLIFPSRHGPRSDPLLRHRLNLRRPPIGEYVRRHQALRSVHPDRFHAEA